MAISATVVKNLRLRSSAGGYFINSFKPAMYLSRRCDIVYILCVMGKESPSRSRGAIVLLDDQRCGSVFRDVRHDYVELGI